MAAVKVKKGVLAAAGTVDLSADFSALDPLRAVIFFASGSVVAEDVSVGSGFFTIGFASNDGGSIQQGYVAGTGENNVGTSIAVSGLNTGAVGRLLNPTSQTTFTVAVELIVTDFDDTSFEVSKTAGSHRWHYVAIGGAAIEAARVFMWDADTSGTVGHPQDVEIDTGWGQPDLLFSATRNETAAGDTATDATMGLGVANASGENRTMALGIDDNNANSSLGHWHGNAGCVYLNGSSVQGVWEIAARELWPVDGFRPIFTDPLPATAKTLTLALKGDIASKIGASTIPTATAPVVTSHPIVGGIPRGAIMFGGSLVASGFDTASVELGGSFLGATDGTNEGCIGYVENDGLTTQFVTRSNSESKTYRAFSGSGQTSAPSASPVTSAADSALTPTSLVLTWPDTDTVARQWSFVIIAEATGPTETDTAGAITPDAGIGAAVETDTASALQRRIAVGQATETDTARRLAVPAGRASETDTARPIVFVELVGQASETDTARPIAVRWFPLIDPAVEADTAARLARIVNRVTETDVAQPIVVVVYIFPEPITVEGAVVFEPALIQGQLLFPDFFDAQITGEVFEPILLGGQPLEPDFFDDQLSPVVFDPTLIQGQPLGPDFFDDQLSPVVFDPRLSHAQVLRPGFWTETAATVFEPELRHAQVLTPERIDLSPVVFAPALVQASGFLYPERIENVVVVFEPALRHGQELEPDTFTGLSVTVFSPRLALNQRLRPDFWSGGLSPTVFDPRLIAGQPLRPSFWSGGLSPTVFDPRLIQGQPLRPDFFDDQLDPEVFDPALEQSPPPSSTLDETRTLSAIRTAR